MPHDLNETIRRIAERLRQRHWMLATAESCTGGGIAQALTALEGSSVWFDGAFVTYSNDAKQAMLGVRTATLAAHGAVSQATAIEMACGAIADARSQVSCAVTGIAGPGGGSPAKPVGTVCFAWALPGQPPTATTRRLFGDRAAVREQSIRVALDGLLVRLVETTA